MPLPQWGSRRKEKPLRFTWYLLTKNWEFPVSWQIDFIRVGGENPAKTQLARTLAESLGHEISQQCQPDSSLGCGLSILVSYPTPSRLPAFREMSGQFWWWAERTQRPNECPRVSIGLSNLCMWLYSVLVITPCLSLQNAQWALNLWNPYIEKGQEEEAPVLKGENSQRCSSEEQLQRGKESKRQEGAPGEWWKDGRQPGSWGMRSIQCRLAKAWGFPVCWQIL